LTPDIKVKVDELFGGARLVAETPEGERHLVYYTKAYVPEFAGLTHVINELAKGKQPPEPEATEPAYCRRCGAPLAGARRQLHRLRPAPARVSGACWACSSPIKAKWLGWWPPRC